MAREPFPGEQKFTHAIPNKAGAYRAHYYKQRVWIAKPVDETVVKLEADTIMRIRDFKGNTEEVFASELLFSNFSNN